MFVQITFRSGIRPTSKWIEIFSVLIFDKYGTPDCRRGEGCLAARQAMRTAAQSQWLATVLRGQAASPITSLALYMPLSLEWALARLRIVQPALEAWALVREGDTCLPAKKERKLLSTELVGGRVCCVCCCEYALNLFVKVQYCLL